MKQIILCALLFISSVWQPSFAFVVAPTLPGDTPAKSNPGIEPVTIKKLEQLTGKRLNFLQRLEWKLVQKRINKVNFKTGDPTDKQKKLGTLSLIFSIAGLAFLLVQVPFLGLVGLGLSIAAFVLGIKSIKGNSNTPGIIGLVVSSLTLLLVLLAIVVLAAWFAGGWY